MAIETYRDFLIDFDPPPIPDRRNDWVATHKDYDGPEDDRIFRAATLEDLYQEIEDWYGASELAKTEA